MTYFVQAYCTGMGWCDVRELRSEDWTVAHAMERELRANDSKWVNPDSERKTRIVSRSDASPTRSDYVAYPDWNEK